MLPGFPVMLKPPGGGSYPVINVFAGSLAGIGDDWMEGYKRDTGAGAMAGWGAMGSIDGQPVPGVILDEVLAYISGATVEYYLSFSSSDIFAMSILDTLTAVKYRLDTTALPAKWMNKQYRANGTYVTSWRWVDWPEPGFGISAPLQMI
jgi:hypothetical protein